MSEAIATITGKVKTRTPTQAQSLASRTAFLNLQNTEPNLGIPTSPGIKNEFVGDDGLRYALLSNNNNSLTGWRVWSYDNPKIAVYSQQNSIALGDNAFPINSNSIVYSNYTYANNNPYNSQSFGSNTFNVFSVSGIYLYDATTIGDPVSATSFIITDNGFVGVNTEFPDEQFTVNGNISANGNFTITGNANLGNTKLDIHTLRGQVQFGDATTVPLLFGNNGGGYDTNLYRLTANNLHTDDRFSCDSLSARNAGTVSTIVLTNANITNLTTATASGDFLILSINGTNRAIRLWDF